MGVSNTAIQAEGGRARMGDISRREFLKRGLDGLAVASTGEPAGSVIDLTKCDGCADREVPAGVSACRTENRGRFPEPQENIGDYWPRDKHEGWSEKRGLTSRLTPYNWTFVQHVTVEHEGQEVEVSVPRRCMCIVTTLPTPKYAPSLHRRRPARVRC